MQQQTTNPSLTQSLQQLISNAPAYALGCDSCSFGIATTGGYCGCKAGEMRQKADQRRRDEEIERIAGEHARREYARQRRFEALVPLDFRGRTAGALAKMDGKGEGARAAVEWMNTGHYANRRGILYTGGYGTGKSTFLYAIATKLFEDRRGVLTVNYGEFCKAIQAEYGKEGSQAEAIIAKALNVDTLLIDDLGTHGREIETPDRIEIVQRIFQHRMDCDLPVIATSNFRMDELAEHFGGRVGRRLRQCCAEVVVNGIDLSSVGLRGI